MSPLRYPPPRPPSPLSSLSHTDTQRRKVLGDKYVDNQLSTRKSEFSRPAQEYITRTAWEGLWSRPGLELKYRSLVVIT